MRAARTYRRLLAPAVLAELPLGLVKEDRRGSTYP